MSDTSPPNSSASAPTPPTKRPANLTPPAFGVRDGVVVVLIVIVSMIALYNISQLHDVPVSSPKKRTVTVETPSAQRVLDKQREMQANRMRDAMQAGVAQVAWAQEKKKLMESDPDPKLSEEPASAISARLHGEGSDIGDPQDWVKVPSRRFEPLNTTNSRLMRVPFTDHLNISKRMGVDAESLSKLTSEQTRQRFSKTIHCLFFERPWPREVTQRLEGEALQSLVNGEIGPLTVKVRGTYVTSSFEVQFTAEDAKAMAHWEWMNQVKQWESDSGNIPAMARFEATKEFEQKWLLQRKERGLRYQEMTWWYERVPLLSRLQKEYKFPVREKPLPRAKLTLEEEIQARLEASDPQPKLSLDEEIIARLIAKIPAKEVSAADPAVTKPEPSLHIQAVSVRNAEW